MSFSNPEATSRIPGRPHHPGILPVGGIAVMSEPDGAAGIRLHKAESELRARSKAAALALIHRGVDEIVDRFDVVVDPTVTQNLVTYTTPDSLVCKISRVAVLCSEPAVAMGLGIGWRLTLNGNELPYVNSAWALFRYFPVVFGDLGNPMRVEPIWVQANETIAVELIVAAGFDVKVLIAGRLGGQLYKPATPETLDI